ncbi:hypothetical protein OESDEN_00023 [Oesophagostomum dentatum]|uniref:NELF-A N-terminal domain-containing protein n=1 Tax=Oesophagostomum dentatum TaxID=61180 RepID=A0A0B1TWU7_OESDE|nr:hypothetical protein OESDEN_00023 [Oesophagostomum dentatum]
MADPGKSVAYFPSSSQAPTLKDMDLVNWLEKKLNDAGVWSGRTTASMLSREMLEELETCFQAIDVQTKLKIICCIPHMNPRKMDMVNNALTTLLDLGSKDADDWVETIADINDLNFRDITSTGVIIPACTNKDSHFSKTLEELTKCFQRHLEAGDLKLTPEGHNIASTSVNKASFGAPPEVQKCFILRKKPKSFNLSNDMTKREFFAFWRSTVPFFFFHLSLFSTYYYMLGICKLLLTLPLCLSGHIESSTPFAVRD